MTDDDDKHGSDQQGPDQHGPDLDGPNLDGPELNGPELNPWAGLDAETEGRAGGDDAAFIFDMLGDGSDEGVKSPADQQPVDGDDGADVRSVDGDLPLAVFPPPDAESGLPGGDGLAEAAPAGADRPGIISLHDASGFESLEAAADGSAGAGDDDEDAFDDAQLARELAFSDAGEDRPDFGDPADPSADDVSFNAASVPSGHTSPFADIEQADAFPSQTDLADESVASIPIAAAAVATAHAPPQKKKKSGIGQLAGVMLGGVMALPITYAILIWGFQKDPFKLARQVPDQVAFLVPQSLRQGGRPARQQPAAARSDAPSQEDLSTSAPESMADAAPAANVTDDASPAEPAESADAATARPASPDGDEAMAEADASKPRDDEPKPPRMDPIAGLELPPELAEEFRAALAKLTTVDEFQAALTRLTAAAGSEPAPMVPAEPAAEPVAEPAAEPAAAVPAPLDLTGLEASVAQATEALDALEAVSDVDDPVRKRLLVAWYRRLAKLGEQFAMIETAAADSGRPLEKSPAAVDGLLERIRGSDLAIDDLRMLGRMWLAAQKRRADGTILVATVESSRHVGPYWSTRVNIAGAHDAARGVAVISRMPPVGDIGDQMLITGVLFDADTVWASDMRPLVNVASTDADVPAIGIPPTFDEPIDPAPVAEPPMLEDEAPVKIPAPTVEPPSNAADAGAEAKASQDGSEPAPQDAAAGEAGSGS